MIKLIIGVSIKKVRWSLLKMSRVQKLLKMMTYIADINQKPQSEMSLKQIWFILLN